MPEGNVLEDRQLDEILSRLDRIAGELERLNAQLDTQDGLQRVAYEVKSLSEAMQALAYAALGTQTGPAVTRRHSA